jgi:hypothetical protein
MMRRNSFAHARRVVRASVWCLLALAAGGCAFVEERRSDGTFENAVVVGSPILLQRPTDQGVVIKASGLGLALSNGTAALGWFDNSIVALAPGCRVVLIGNSDEQLRKFAELTGDAREICAINRLAGGKR